jgi:hypothetical protein
VDAQSVVERVGTRAGDRQRGGRTYESEVELEPALGDPEPLAQVNCGDGDEHRADDGEASERGQQAESKEKAASKLG